METRVTVRSLSGDEIQALLARNRVGRLACAVRNNVDVETVPYVYDNSWLYGRITPELKLTLGAHHRFVAFQVDEVASPAQWRSALVRGACYVLQPEGSAPDRSTYERARALVDAALPERAAAGVDAAELPPLFRIPAYHATGRACEGAAS